MLVVLFLVLAAFIFIETPFGQNWLAKKITDKFSKELNTKISFKHISFSLLNRLNLEGFLLEDQKNDTLLYAGNLQVRITDWFIFKDKADLKYVGLENSVIKLHRSDSTWNYQFIVDYFTPSTPSKTENKNKGIEFDLKNLTLKNVVLIQKDAWTGQDMTAAVGSLQLNAKQINPDKKNIDINSLYLSHPFFSIANYDGNEPSSPKEKDPVIINSSAIVDSLLQWNQDEWRINIASLTIDNGSFKNLQQTDEPTVPYFDPTDIEFGNIHAEFNDVRLEKDTFSARIAHLDTKERSGFVVRSLSANASMNPKGMFFSDLDIKTNNSTIRNYFSMSYEDFDDMNYFIHKVKMRADFNESQISSDDIAFFAPELKTWKKEISVSGKVRGTVADISGRNMVINAGKNTYIDGDITLSGLPDIDQTFIDFKSNDSRTNYNDVVKFVPDAKDITTPDLASLGNIHLTGSFTGFLHDFVTFGTIGTDLGILKTDINIKLPKGKQPVYSGNIATNNFQLGKFLANSQIGSISLSGFVKGSGFDIDHLETDVKANVSQFDFNGYRYHNIIANGTFEKHLFNGIASVNDSNLRATLNGLININGADSKFDLVADVQTANLYALQFTPDEVNFNGKFNLNFTGNNIDNFTNIAFIPCRSFI